MSPLFGSEKAEDVSVGVRLTPAAPSDGEDPLEHYLEVVAGVITFVLAGRYFEMRSKRRARAVARPRQVAMYLAKKMTPRSLPEIGRIFGGRDHSTVIHAVRTIEALRETSPDMDADVRALQRLLEG